MDSGNQLTCSFFFPFLSFLTLYWSPDHRVGEQYWGESPYLTEVNLETLPQIYPKFVSFIIVDPVNLTSLQITIVSLTSGKYFFFIEYSNDS